MKNCYMIISNKRQTTKIRKVFSNNISADVQVSKAQIFKITQSCG